MQQYQAQGGFKPAAAAVGTLASYEPGRHFCELGHSAVVSRFGEVIRERLDLFGLDELGRRARGRGRALQPGDHLHDLQRG
jgi:hypothetical protein